MRRIISATLVAVSLLAVTGVGVTAQDEPAAVAIVPAGLNADKIDGRHAVGHRASRKKRAGKLVATNKQGFLPSNIIRPAWRLILGKPAVFADGRITWGEVQNKPGGFTDGVDNVGYVSEVHSSVYYVPGGGSTWVFADVPLGSDVEMTLIPIGAVNQLEITGETWQRLDATTLRHWYEVTRFSGETNQTFKVRTRVFNEGISSVGLAKVARQVKVGIGKNPRK